MDLLKGFIWFGRDYISPFQPINMIKNYYGEKYAFTYAFLLHYQAWLIIPSVLGVLLFFYQLYLYKKTGLW